jgi:hypothetical protein
VQRDELHVGLGQLGRVPFQADLSFTLLVCGNFCGNFLRFKRENEMFNNKKEECSVLKEQNHVLNNSNSIE